MPLRIAYISSTFPDFDGCGTGIYAGYLTQALSGLNHDIHVITSAREEIKNTHARVTMHKVMTDWGLSQAPRMIQTLMQIRPQIIHLNHPTVIAGAKSKFLVNLLPEICATMMKVPFVTTLHEFGQVSRLGKIKLQPLLWGSDAITVTNKHYKNLIEKSLSNSMSKKIEIVDVGTNFDDGIIKKANLPSKCKLKEKWGFKNEDCVLGFFGFLTPPKGFHNLLEILSLLNTFRSSSSNNLNYKILALSSWNLTKPDYKEKLLERIRELGLESQIVFTGYMSDEALWENLGAIDVAAFPFDYPVEERSSGVLRQALFKGLPTITFANDLKYSEGGLENNKNVFLSPFKDKQEFAKRLDSFVTSSTYFQDSEKVSQEALKLRPSLSFEHVANEMNRVYSKLI